MFSAQGPWLPWGESIPVYWADNITVGIGCTEKFQLKNPSNQQSSILASRVSTANSMPDLGFNARQLAAVSRIMNSANYFQMSDLVSGGWPSILKAQQLVSNQLSPGLPPNQWQQELAGFFEVNLAFQQTHHQASGYQPTS